MKRGGFIGVLGRFASGLRPRRRSVVIALAAMVLLILAALGGMARSRNERMALYSWRSRGWRDHF